MISYIHFIRHGITQGVANKWYYGFTDLPLTKEGREEILKLKNEGIYPNTNSQDITPDFYTSGMTRTNETLKLIYGDVPYKKIDKLMEMNFGDWECSTFSQLQEKIGFEDWMNTADGSFRFPNGESANDFILRVESGLKELKSAHALKALSLRHKGEPAHSIVSCHGGVIGTAMNLWFPKEKDNFWLWIPKVARGYTVKLEDNEPVSYVEI